MPGRGENIVSVATVGEKEKQQLFNITKERRWIRFEEWKN